MCINNNVSHSVRYILLQGFDQAPIVSQKRPEIPKVKQDEQPIPVAIFQIEDSDLLNFMSGGLTVSNLASSTPYNNEGMLFLWMFVNSGMCDFLDN